MPGFEKAGAAVIGISRDSERAQRSFAEKACLPFPMLCDRDGTVVAAYGVRGLFGFAKRVSFLIDGEGVVRKVYSDVAPRTHAADVLHDLEALTGPAAEEA